MALITPKTGFEHMISLEIKPQFLPSCEIVKIRHTFDRLMSVNVFRKFHDEVTKIIRVLVPEIKFC